MAARAGRGERASVIVGVAKGARGRRVETGEREDRGAVIEGRRGPGGGVVASGASCREIGRDVVGRRIRIVTEDRGVVEIGGMAADAGRRQRARVVVGMAQGALSRQVETCQRENRGAVIERRRRPRGGGVAERAGCGETG